MTGNTIGETPEERELIEELRNRDDPPPSDPLAGRAATLLESLISDRAKLRRAHMLTNNA